MGRIFIEYRVLNPEHHNLQDLICITINKKEIQMERRSLTIVSFFVFIAVLFSSNLLLAGQKPILLKVPTTYAAALPGLGTTTTWIAQRLHIASSGSLKMKIYEPGKLVAPFEILDAVSKGKVNAGYSISGYWEGKMPGSSIFSTIPFGPEAGEFLAWMYYGNGRKLYQKMYDDAGFNVHVIPCGIIAPETGGWFKKENGLSTSLALCYHEL